VNDNLLVGDAFLVFGECTKDGFLASASVRVNRASWLKAHLLNKLDRSYKRGWKLSDLEVSDFTTLDVIDRLVDIQNMKLP
jgi:hypothetical protein